MIKQGLTTAIAVMAAVSGVHFPSPQYYSCPDTGGGWAYEQGAVEAGLVAGSHCDAGRVSLAVEAPGVLRWSCRATGRGAPLSLLEETFLGADFGGWRGDLSGVVSQLGEIYSGIQMRVESHPAGPVRVLTFAPQADPGQVLVSLDTRLPLRLDGCGNLELNLEGMPPLTVVRPVAYQDAPGGRHCVDVQLLWNDGRYGLHIGRHDLSDTLTVELRAF